MPPIVVVQHMPLAFTKPFAWRLNSISQFTIKEAETGDVLSGALAGALIAEATRWVIDQGDENGE